MTTSQKQLRTLGVMLGMLAIGIFSAGICSGGEAAPYEQPGYQKEQVHREIESLTAKRQGLADDLQKIQMNINHLSSLQQQARQGDILLRSRSGVPVTIAREQVPDVVDFLMLRESVAESTSEFAGQWLGVITDADDLPLTPDQREFWTRALQEESRKAEALLSGWIQESADLGVQIERIIAIIDQDLQQEYAKIGRLDEYQQEYEEYSRSVQQQEQKQFMDEFLDAFTQQMLMNTMMNTYSIPPPIPAAPPGSQGGAPVQPNLKGLEKDLQKMDRIFKGAVGR